MKKYRLTSPKIEGEIYLIYTDGYFTGCELCLRKPFDCKQFQFFFRETSYHEQFLLQHGLGAMLIEEVVVEASNIKIARFCDKYFFHNKCKYSVSASDAGKIKLIELPEAMLEHYFRSENFLFKGKHSIANLVRYFNELRSEYTTKVYQKASAAHKKDKREIPGINYSQFKNKLLNK